MLDLDGDFLQFEKYSIPYKHVHLQSISYEERRRSLDKWQRRWEESATVSWTRRLFPDVVVQAQQSSMEA